VSERFIVPIWVVDYVRGAMGGVEDVRDEAGHFSRRRLKSI
jgi:hypothetical protein